MNKETMLWLRVGDGGDYDEYGSNMFAVASALTNYDLGGNIAARPGGFTSGNYQGDNYVSLYWGDDEGNLDRSLTDDEFEELINQISFE